MGTFLTIAQETHRKMRGGNAKPGSKPSAIPVPTTPAEDQMVYDCVNEVQNAWENLQNKHSDWLWMRKRGTLALVAGTRIYNMALLRASIPDYDWVFAFDATDGNVIYINVYDGGATTRVDQPCWFVPYENWRGWKDRRPLVANAQPRFFTQLPDYSLEFDPTPNVTPTGGAWLCDIDYRKTNQTLVNQGDVPELPLRFHDLIAWMAVELICETRGSTALLAALAEREIYGGPARNGGRLNQLEVDQLAPLLINTRFC